MKSTANRVQSAIRKVLRSKSKKQLGFMSPKLRQELKWAPTGGLYRYGGPGTLTHFDSSVPMQSAMTSTRIAASKAKDVHWLIDVISGYPVVVRIVDPGGKTIYRVEEYAATL